MTSVTDFLSKQNVQLIWDVLIDEESIKNNSNNVLQEINNKINQIIVNFYENEKQTTNNLMELNKRFITTIINYVNNKFPKKTNNGQIQGQIQGQMQGQMQGQTQGQMQGQNKMNEPITFEDLQTQRLSDFDKQLAKKQSEFTSAITLQLPEKPKFSDNMDTPIAEIEIEVKKMVAQRNYDIEQINKALNTEDVNKWLKPKETSIKNEKLIQNTFNRPTNKETTNKETTNKGQEIRYIKIDKTDISNAYENEVIDLNSPKKHISWADENITLQMNDLDQSRNLIGREIGENENNIFKKLKLLPSMLQDYPEQEPEQKPEQLQKEKEKEKEKEKQIPNYESKITNMETEIQNLNSKVDEINNRLFELFKVLQKK